MTNLNRGFTLIEAMVALALLAILASVAAPSFKQMIHAQQIKRASIDLSMALVQSRNEAITRQKPVIINNLDNDWSTGWKIFVDLDGDGVFDTNEPVLKTADSIASGVRISGNTPVSRYVRYMPSGEAKMQSGAFQAGTITLCHVDGQQSIRQLVLSVTGRVRTVRGHAGSC